MAPRHNGTVSRAASRAPHGAEPAPQPTVQCRAIFASPRYLDATENIAGSARRDSPRVRMSSMTVVLVHGNPETDAIWGPLVEALARTDVVRLSPPGFGAPLPDSFPTTYLAYRDWL